MGGKRKGKGRHSSKKSRKSGPSAPRMTAPTGGSAAGRRGSGQAGAAASFVETGQDGNSSSSRRAVEGGRGSKRASTRSPSRDGDAKRSRVASLPSSSAPGGMPPVDSGGRVRGSGAAASDATDGAIGIASAPVAAEGPGAEVASTLASAPASDGGAVARSGAGASASAVTTSVLPKDAPTRDTVHPPGAGSGASSHGAGDKVLAGAARVEKSGDASHRVLATTLPSSSGGGVSGERAMSSSSGAEADVRVAACAVAVVSGAGSAAPLTLVAPKTGSGPGLVPSSPARGTSGRIETSVGGMQVERASGIPTQPMLAPVAASPLVASVSSVGAPVPPSTASAQQAGVAAQDAAEGGMTAAPLSHRLHQGAALVAGAVPARRAAGGGAQGADKNASACALPAVGLGNAPLVAARPARSRADVVVVVGPSAAAPAPAATLSWPAQSSSALAAAPAVLSAGAGGSAGARSGKNLAGALPLAAPSRAAVAEPLPAVPQGGAAMSFGTRAGADAFEEQQMHLRLWDVRIPAYVVRCVDGAHVWRLVVDIAARGFRTTSGMMAVTRHIPGDGSVSISDWVRTRCATESGLDPRSVLRILMDHCAVLEPSGSGSTRLEEAFHASATAASSIARPVVLVNGLHRILSLTLLYAFGTPLPDPEDAGVYDGMGGFLGGRLPAVGRQLRAGEPAPPPPKMPDFAALPASLLTSGRNGGGLSAAEALAVGRQLNVDTGVVARHHSLADELTFAQNFARSHAHAVGGSVELPVAKLVELWAAASAARMQTVGAVAADASASSSKMEKYFRFAVWASESPESSRLIIEHERRSFALAERISALQRGDSAVVAEARRLMGTLPRVGTQRMVTQRELGRLVNAVKAADPTAGADKKLMLLGIEAFTVAALMAPPGIPACAFDTARACAIYWGYNYTGSCDRTSGGKTRLRRLRGGNEVVFFQSALTLLQQFVLFECAAYGVSPGVLYGYAERAAEAVAAAAETSPSGSATAAASHQALRDAREARAAVEGHVGDAPGSLRVALNWPAARPTLPAARPNDPSHPLLARAEEAARSRPPRVVGSNASPPSVLPNRWVADTLNALVFPSDTARYNHLVPDLQAVSSDGESLKSYLARLLCRVGMRIRSDDLLPAAPAVPLSAADAALYAEDSLDEGLGFRPPFGKIARELARTVVNRLAAHRRQLRSSAVPEPRGGGLSRATTAVRDTRDGGADGEATGSAAVELAPSPAAAAAPHADSTPCGGGAGPSAPPSSPGPPSDGNCSGSTPASSSSSICLVVRSSMETREQLQIPPPVDAAVAEVPSNVDGDGQGGAPRIQLPAEAAVAVGSTPVVGPPRSTAPDDNSRAMAGVLAAASGRMPAGAASCRPLSEAAPALPGPVDERVRAAAPPLPAACSQDGASTTLAHPTAAGNSVSHAPATRAASALAERPSSSAPSAVVSGHPRIGGSVTQGASAAAVADGGATAPGSTPMDWTPARTPVEARAASASVLPTAASDAVRELGGPRVGLVAVSPTGGAAGVASATALPLATAAASSPLARVAAAALGTTLGAPELSPGAAAADDQADDQARSGTSAAGVPPPSAPERTAPPPLAESGSGSLGRPEPHVRSGAPPSAGAGGAATPSSSPEQIIAAGIADGAEPHFHGLPPVPAAGAGHQGLAAAEAVIVIASSPSGGGEAPDGSSAPEPPRLEDSTAAAGGPSPPRLDQRRMGDAPTDAGEGSRRPRRAAAMRATSALSSAGASPADMSARASAARKLTFPPVDKADGRRAQRSSAVAPRAAPPSSLGASPSSAAGPPVGSGSAGEPAGRSSSESPVLGRSSPRDPSPPPTALAAAAQAVAKLTEEDGEVYADVQQPVPAALRPSSAAAHAAHLSSLPASCSSLPVDHRALLASVMSTAEWRSVDTSMRRYFVRQARCEPVWQRPEAASRAGAGAHAAAEGDGDAADLVELARHVTGLNHDLQHAGHVVLPDILRAVHTTGDTPDVPAGPDGEAGVGRDLHALLLRCLRAFPAAEDRAGGAHAQQQFAEAKAARRAHRAARRGRGRGGRLAGGGRRRQHKLVAPALPLRTNVNEFWEFIVNDVATDAWLRPHGIGRMTVPVKKTCDYLENKSFALFKSKIRVDAVLASAAHLLLSSDLLPPCDRIQARTLRTGARVLLTTVDAGPQMPHTDYLPDKETLSHPPTTMFRCRKFFFLATGADPAALRVWVNSHTMRLGDQAAVDLLAEAHPGLLIRLPPYSIGIFRGDGVHAGAAWADEGERCAAYERAARAPSRAEAAGGSAAAPRDSARAGSESLRTPPAAGGGAARTRAAHPSTPGGPSTGPLPGTDESGSSTMSTGHTYVYPRSVRLHAYLHPDGTPALPDGVELMTTARRINPYRMRPASESLPSSPSGSDAETLDAPSSPPTVGKGKARAAGGTPRGRRRR